MLLLHRGELIPGFNRSYLLEDFLWARSAISTRVFGWRLPGLPTDATEFMVPLGDMFNHRSSKPLSPAKSNVQWCYAFNLLPCCTGGEIGRSPKQIEWFYNSTAQTLDFWTREEVQKGSELLISYGGKCNSEYLLHYGFAAPDIHSRQPPLSTVRLLLDLDEGVQDRAQLQKLLLKSRLKEEGPLEPEEFRLKAAWKGSEAEQLIAYARLLSMSYTEVVQRFRTRSCREFSTPPRCEQAMGLENEQLALTRCLKAVDVALSAYPTSVEEDESLIPTLQGVAHSLVLLRRDEKLVLRWWQHWFQVALQALNLEKEQIEELADRTFGRLHSDGDYLRLRLAPLMQ
eukprot:953667-Amphidinium_carterae.1